VLQRQGGREGEVTLKLDGVRKRDEREQGSWKEVGLVRAVKRTRFPSISFLHFFFNYSNSTLSILIISYCPCRLLFRESQLSVSEKRVPGDSSFRTGTTFHFSSSFNL
jgi:hypothetical protein